MRSEFFAPINWSLVYYAYSKTTGEGLYCRHAILKAFITISLCSLVACDAQFGLTLTTETGAGALGSLIYPVNACSIGIVVLDLSFLMNV